VHAEELFVGRVTDPEPAEASAGRRFSELKPRSDRKQPLSPLGMLRRSDVLERQVVVGEKCQGRG
jgi:hypothetical protein